MKHRITYHILIVLLLLVGVLTFSSRHVTFNHQLRWDVFGYYLYLPATFIYDDPDLDQAWVDQIYDDYYVSETRYQLYPQEGGKHVIKYSAGLAVIYAPGFVIGHLYALASDTHAADGFSPPYAVAVSIWCYLLISLGVLLFYGFIRRLFSPLTALLTTVGVLLGTNLLVTAFFAPLMPHGLLFFLYVLLLWFTAKAVDANSFRHAIAAAIIFALIALSRPSEMIALILPLTYGWGAGKGLLAKGGLLRRTGAWKHWLVLISVIAAIGSLQLWYWKTTTGEWLYYSYDNPGEGLDLWSPHLWESLFSFRKGWWLYTPLALVALVGLLHPALSRRGWRTGALLFMLFTIWIVSSWTTWWFAGSFGQRAYVQSYAVLFLGLATLIEVVRELPRLIRSIAAGLFVLLIALNLFQTWQFTAGILPDDRITEDYYNAIFLRTEVPSNAEEMLLIDRFTNGASAWERRSSYRTTADTSFVVYEVKNEKPPDFPWLWEFESGAKFTEDHAFIDIAWKNLGTVPDSGTFTLVTCAFHDGEVYNWRGHECSLAEDSGSTYFLTPHFRTAEDRFKIEVWNPDLSLIDSLAIRVRILEP